jgi:hypothetical protein
MQIATQEQLLLAMLARQGVLRPGKVTHRVTDATMWLSRNFEHDMNTRA